MSIQLGTARWSSTRSQPFAPAPGGGLASTRWTSTVPTPFGPAPGGGRFGEMYNSGFAAERVADPTISMEPERVLAKGPFTVVKEPVGAGDTPSLVIRMRYTDRGSLTKGQLDAQVEGLLKKAGLKVSKATSLKSMAAVWRWGKIGAEASGDVPIFVPVLASGPWAGMRYAGSAFSESLYEPSAQALARIPGQIWVYTIAVTSAHNTMSDGEAAQALTLLKQAMVNMSSAQGYANVLVTQRGCPSGVFGGTDKAAILPKPLKAGFSALLLLVAYNMVSPHIGSEVL